MNAFPDSENFYKDFPECYGQLLICGIMTPLSVREGEDHFAVDRLETVSDINRTSHRRGIQKKLGTSLGFRRIGQLIHQQFGNAHPPPRRTGIHVGNVTVLSRGIFIGRRMGIAKLLVNQLADAAKDEGCAQLFLNASPMGRSVYVRYGFQPINGEMIFTLPR